MTGSVVRLDAQWALHGKTADEGYRVLACSTGDLSARNFADAISRFQLGALNTLPQVSVSYAQLGSPSQVNYIALAGHQFADDGRRLRHDANGAQITYTSYFCVPYLSLAEAGINYQALYGALHGIHLPTPNGLPVPVLISAPTLLTPAVDPLAIRIAALLLTGRRVCVLGAQETTVDDRLRSIDATMALLPYGVRARMTAATWTRATNRDHRFRLFFSDAPRAADPPDHVVTWGHPEHTVITPADGLAFEYLTWLEDTVGKPLARLSGLTEPLSLSRDQRSRTLADIGITGEEPAQADTTASQDAPQTEATPISGSDPTAKLLLRLARRITAGNLDQVKADIESLRNHITGHTPGTERRARYREIIKEHQLLGTHESLGRLDRSLHTALLDLAFGTPLSYEGYCQVEDCLKIQPGEQPHPTLLQAIERSGMSDQKVAAIVHWHLRVTDKMKLNRLVSGQVDPVQMIALLAGDWERTQHARIACDLTLHYLRNAPTRYEPSKLQVALRQHGFLSGVLSKRHPDDDQYQVSALCQFLKAAYPSGLGRTGIVQVLTGGPPPPAPALLAAVVLELSSRPGYLRLAYDAYAYGSLTLMDVDPATSSLLREGSPRMRTDNDGG